MLSKMKCLMAKARDMEYPLVMLWHKIFRWLNNAGKLLSTTQPMKHRSRKSQPKVEKHNLRQVNRNLTGRS